MKQSHTGVAVDNVNTFGVDAIPGTVARQTDTDHPVIRIGTKGVNVVAWQKVLGVTADGDFGPATDTATRAWQSSHGLKADGIVGPLTWATAGVQPVAVKNAAIGLGATLMALPLYAKLGISLGVLWGFNQTMKGGK